MIEHVWTVACERVVIDRKSNNVSMQSVIEQFRIAGEPKERGRLPQRFHLITLWTRTEDNKPCLGFMRFSLLSPSEKKLAESEHELNLVDTERYRVVISIPGLPVEEGGRYVFKIDLKQEGESEWREVQRVPLMVTFFLPKIEEDVSDEYNF